MKTAEIQLNPPKVEGNRVLLSWSPHPLFPKMSFWISFPDLHELDASPGKLAEAYFPVCLAFAALGDVRIRLPVRLDEKILEHWSQVIEILRRSCFSFPGRTEFENGIAEPGYRPAAGGRTALFFGGGTESLLTYAHLRKEGVRPVLVCLGGPQWAGSNPNINRDKFAMDELFAKEQGLELLRVRTNFREIVYQDRWHPYLRSGLSVMNAVLSLPYFISMIFPAVERLGISACVNGNERMNFPREYFCFSPGLTPHLQEVAFGLTYESRLHHLLKEEVCRELYRKHPDLARYQYSCWHNRNRRWCHRCESCLEYYMLATANGLAPSEIGLDRAEVRRNILRLIWTVTRAPEARPGEIWPRICRYPELRRDGFLRSVLDAIRLGSWAYRRYGDLPEGPRKVFRRLKSSARRIGSALRRGWSLALQAFSYDCWIIHGREKDGGGEFCCVYAGIERHKNYFAKAACGQDYRERALGRVWAGGVIRKARRSHPDCALAVFEVSPVRRPFGPGKTPFRIPVWIETEVDISRGFDELRADNDFRSVRKRIRKNRYAYVVSDQVEAFDEFYWNMYVPHVTQTYGKETYLHDYGALRERFAQGELLLVGRDNEIIGGQLIEYRDGFGRLDCFGVRSGYEEYVRMGLVGALNYFSMLRMKEKGCKRVDFGYSRAFLKDGALQFKARLGAGIGSAHHEESGFLGLKCLRLTPGLKSFLAHNPFIVEESSGCYRAVLFVEGADLAREEDWRQFVRDFFYVGLDGLDVYVFGPPPQPQSAAPQSLGGAPAVFHPAEAFLNGNARVSGR